MTRSDSFRVQKHITEVKCLYIRHQIFSPSHAFSQSLQTISSVEFALGPSTKDVRQMGRGWLWNFGHRRTGGGGSLWKFERPKISEKKTQWAGIHLRVISLDSPKVLRAMVASRVVLFLITVELIALIAAWLSQLIIILLPFILLSKRKVAVFPTANTSTCRTVLFLSRWKASLWLRPPLLGLLLTTIRAPTCSFILEPSV